MKKMNKPEQAMGAAIGIMVILILGAVVAIGGWKFLAWLINI